MKIDFPFRVTDREHAVINLQSYAPILLLGRSGTGKTTCCLYRLWSRFLTYWTKAREMNYDPWLPRTVHYTTEDDEGEDSGTYMIYLPDLVIVHAAEKLFAFIRL